MPHERDALTPLGELVFEDFVAKVRNVVLQVLERHPEIIQKGHFFRDITDEIYSDQTIDITKPELITAEQVEIVLARILDRTLRTPQQTGPTNIN